MKEDIVRITVSKGYLVDNDTIPDIHGDYEPGIGNTIYTSTEYKLRKNELIFDNLGLYNFIKEFLLEGDQNWQLLNSSIVVNDTYCTFRADTAYLRYLRSEGNFDKISEYILLGLRDVIRGLVTYLPQYSQLLFNLELIHGHLINFTWERKEGTLFPKELKLWINRHKIQRLCNINRKSNLISTGSDFILYAEDTIRDYSIIHNYFLEADERVESVESTSTYLCSMYLDLNTLNDKYVKIDFRKEVEEDKIQEYKLNSFIDLVDILNILSNEVL